MGEFNMKKATNQNLLKNLINILCLISIIMLYRFENCLADVKFRTESEVAAYVDSITGFRNIKGITKTFKHVVINDDNTPFLHKQINGRKNVWVSEYKDFKLELKSSSNEDKYKRNFKVYVDSNDGTLLKITSKFEGFDQNLLPEPNAALAEKKIRNVSEVYLGIPKESPKINFLDALDAVIIGNPFEAKEIDAIYTWNAKGGKEPRRVWVITLRGLPPQDFILPYSPTYGIQEQPAVWQRNHIRNIVDADSGKCLFSSFAPQPEDPNKTKK